MWSNEVATAVGSSWRPVRDGAWLRDGVRPRVGVVRLDATVLVGEEPGGVWRLDAEGEDADEVDVD